MKNYLSRKNDNTFGLSFWDDPFENFFKPFFYGERQVAMRTDIKETENGYELSVDIPGFDKSEISVKLNNGYLTISAEKQEKNEDINSYLRRERNYSCSRKYFIGDDVETTDVKAKYENGILTLSIPKKEEKKLNTGNIDIE